MTSHPASRPAAIRRQAQRHRAVDHRDAVPAAVHRGEPLFELGDFVSVEPTPMAAAQRAEHARLFALAEDGPRGERARPDWEAAE